MFAEHDLLQVTLKIYLTLNTADSTVLEASNFYQTSSHSAEACTNIAEHFGAGQGTSMQSLPQHCQGWDAHAVGGTGAGCAGAVP